jgi:DNA-binding NarL/FixJ family response regulator
VNILISVKSRVIGEALYELLKKDNNGDLIFLDDLGSDVHYYLPDLIIVDQGRLNEDFVSRWPQTKLVLLDTGLQQEKIITLILMYKLHGVLSTDEDTGLVKKALKLVHEDQIWINNSNLRALLNKAGTDSRSGKIDNISKREKEILEHITKGRKNKEIAEQLYVSEQTVKAHISHIFKKFNVSSRTQLISLFMNSSQEFPSSN